MSNADLAVYRNEFALIVDIDDYEGKTYLQTKRSTYEESWAWVKRNYGLHVSNPAVSWTKDRCGLAKARTKKGKGPGEPYATELTPEKEAVIPSCATTSPASPSVASPSRASAIASPPAAKGPWTTSTP